ncbi:MAG: hypothetical protein KAG61_02870, partial [Bacteriovoracaceae bacterium]|nr:hypothetical protein [Bacteriovoracaceae bacterium]
DKIVFRIIGDGGRKSLLESALQEHKCSNVQMVKPVDRTELLNEYLGADILFLHLNDYDAFKKVLPSKIFEYAATGKPIWAGVSGFAAEFLLSEVENVAVFSPCDIEEGKTSYSKLSLTHTPRKFFIDKYSRSRIMHNMSLDILSLLN